MKQKHSFYDLLERGTRAVELDCQLVTVTDNLIEDLESELKEVFSNDLDWFRETYDTGVLNAWQARKVLWKIFFHFKFGLGEPDLLGTLKRIRQQYES